ncbi:hypothetical protein Glove_196g62 [Diversispora epigaea]|uniref:Uncharacterized protein n=1 Tax=Diversispora epigaea TaxID=1348612 RepID=A0A397IV81_9GLOM|nr:hypothetical protein Glove_196g62 [Diversispora epigaea]
MSLPLLELQPQSQQIQLKQLQSQQLQQQSQPTSQIEISQPSHLNDNLVEWLIFYRNKKGERILIQDLKNLKALSQVAVALNVLQACHAAYNYIDETVVYKCAGNLETKDIKYIVNIMLNNN